MAGDEDLEKLGTAIDSAAFRRSFAQDPLAAMQGAGINSSEIPENVLDTLAELSPSELRVLSTVKHSLHGKSDKVIAQIV